MDDCPSTYNRNRNWRAAKEEHKERIETAGMIRCRLHQGFTCRVKRKHIGVELNGLPLCSLRSLAAI
jgi:hypothetical protein